MRRATLLLAAVAALAGCSVETEGAACEVPGATEQCPSGQRCGLDLRCSERAAEEGCAFCTPGATSCDPGGGVRTCVAGDAVCNVYQAAPCTAGLSCEEAAGAAACVCPPGGNVLAFDPERSGTVEGTGVTPTGAAEPAGCRLGSLEAALAAAPAGPVTIRAYRPASGPLVVVSSEAVVLRSGMLLTTDAQDSSLYFLRRTAGDGPVLRLESGAELRSFTVESAGSTGDVVEVACGSDAGAIAQVQGVQVDGGGQAARGVAVTGACGLGGLSLRIRGAVGSGLVVATTATYGVQVRGFSSTGNGSYGVLATAGKLVLEGEGDQASISGNGLGGIRLEGGALDATLEDLLVTDNGGVGLFVDAGGAAVTVRGTTLAKNDGTSYGPLPQRSAGGVILRAAAPATFVFAGNTVCSNGGDEVGVYSSAAWSLAGGDTTCLASPVVNNRLGDSAGGRILHSTSGLVDARYNFWSPDPPDAANATTDPSCGSFALPPVCN